MKDNSSNKSRGKRPRVAQKHKTHRTVPNQIGKGFHVKNSWIKKKQEEQTNIRLIAYMIKPTFTVADLLTRGIKQHICVDKIDQDLNCACLVAVSAIFDSRQMVRYFLKILFFQG